MGCSASSDDTVRRPESFYVKRDDGNEYEGEYVEGKMRGYGKMKYLNGDMYIGNWSDNKFHGLGL